MSTTPTLISLAKAEAQRTQTRFIERISRDTLPNLTEESVNDVNSVMLVTVANSEILSGSITIHPDFLCLISQLIPENAIVFSGTLYERLFGDKYR